MHVPIQHLSDAAASFEVFNSPLSEYAAVGFEYGYSVAAPESLVLWEAQFGDFVNGAQIVIDQFIVAGLSKWGQTSRLTLLLPHGYEGNGPEHSSARLERFLQLAAQENIRVANLTTAAQYFHLLRRQALDPSARPLVVMTPKGLLRLRLTLGTLEDLSEGKFQPVIDDREADHAGRAGSSSAPASSTTTSSATRRGPRPRTSPSRGSSSSTLPGRPRRRARPGYPVSRRSSGPRRSRRTWAPGARCGTGSRRRPRGRRAGALRRPAVAGEPERGLPDRPPARAGPDRQRSPRLARGLARAPRRAGPPVGERRGGGPGVPAGASPR